MSTARNNWTRSQTLAALHVYFELPFGKLHQRHSTIVELASWIGRTPSSVAMKLVNFASLDPVIVASGRSGMKGASAQDRAIWDELAADWDRVATEAAEAYGQLASTHGVLAAEATDLSLPMPEGLTRTAEVQVRVNQARFRRSVLTSYRATCCITGIQNEKLLFASHIVPWSVDTKNRLNPRNGLCLSALHDRAFDQGLMTVMPDTLEVRVSPALMSEGHPKLQDALLRFDGCPIATPERFAPDPAFLTWHAQHFGYL